MRVVFSRHAYTRMLERGITSDEVLAGLRSGEVIEEYPRTRAWPCRLVFWEQAGRSLHIVAAEDLDLRAIIVVSVYRPDPGRWHPGYRRRR